MINVSTLLQPLRSRYIHAFLYGSQVKTPRPDRDIDILFVCVARDRETEIADVRRIQEASETLIHPVFVTQSVLDSNPYFGKLFRGSQQIW